VQGRVRLNAPKAACHHEAHVAALIHADKIHCDIQRRAKAQATLPRPSPTPQGRERSLARLGFQATSDL